MSLAIVVYSFLRLRFAKPTHRACSKDCPDYSDLSAYSKTKTQKHLRTGRGAGCCIESGYSLGQLHTDTLGVASSPADRRKGPKRKKTHETPSRNRPSCKNYDTTPQLRCNRFSICPCSVSRRHAIIRLSFCRVKNIELLFNIMEAEPFGHDEHSGQ